MSVASLELSKKLYELSGWEDTRDIYAITHEEDSDSGCYSSEIIARSSLDHYKLLTHDAFRKNKKDMTVKSFSAYDCGYLLRKLGMVAWVELNGNGVDIWYAKSNQRGSHLETVEADTPEDALCKLAIKLFEEGVL